MDKGKQLTIEFPDDPVIQSQIELIVAKGLPKPISFLSYVSTMYRQIGFKHLFRDWTEIIFILLLGTLVMAFMAMLSLENRNAEGIYYFIFIVSPLLYLTVSLLFFANLKQRDTFQVEMTCTYNVYQLASIRMLTFSAVCMVLNLLFVCYLAAKYGQIDIFRAVLISASSLFLFASVFLYAMLRSNTSWIKTTIICGWPAANVLLHAFVPAVYSLLLSSIPVYMYVVLIAVCVIFHMKHIKQLSSFRGMKGAV